MKLFTNLFTNLFSVLLIIMMLSGCSWTRDLLVKTEPVERIPLVLPEPDRYVHRELKWIVVTADNVNQVFAQLHKQGKPVAIIGLAGDDYELLSLNISDQQVLIKQLNAVIKAYKTYYIAVEKRDSDLEVIK